MADPLRFRSAAAWVVVAFCGAVQALAHRFYVQPDGVSYLNLSDAYARGDWAAAVNTFWSPVYPWIFGAVHRLYEWPMYWESSIVHAINFAIYLASYACFRFMLRELTLYQQEKKKDSPAAYFIDWTHGWEFVVAHMLFLWSALLLIGLAVVSPDMMIAAEVYLIVGLMLRVLGRRPGMRYPILLGLLLGLGYLTKAVMFPIAFLVIACTAWGTAKARWTHLATAVCTLSFLVVAAPQLIAMSREVGRPSFGENGTINYALYVNGYDQYWTGTPPGRGIPAHPIRRLMENPTVYEFATNDASSSYPFWDKPAYWLQGFTPHFNFSEQITAIRLVTSYYAATFATFVLVGAILVLMRVPDRRFDLLGICIASAGVFALYALVHAEGRYLGPWTVSLFLAVASGAQFRDDISSRGATRAVFVALALWYGLVIANVVQRATAETARVLAGHGASHEYWTVASELRKLGLQRGQRVASIGPSSQSYWARLAGVQIAMEIPLDAADQYWILDAAGRSRIEKVFTDHGAKMAVAIFPPAGGGPGWIRLGSSAFYALPLTQLPSASSR